jgi:predicted  nucleic acid-binding Zn-ribbon protein
MALRGRSITPWSPIPDGVRPFLEGENEKVKGEVEVEDLREEMGIQEHLNRALKEENAAAVAYTKKLEEQVRGLQKDVEGLREQVRGLNEELEKERRGKEEEKEKKRVERRKMDPFWDGRVFD